MAAFDIEKHFDLLLDTAGSIPRLRELILQLAVMGKLVPQDPNDEPTSVLLERIRKEREKLIADGAIKKPKALPPIAQDELPFELPVGWQWVRLQDIGIINPRNEERDATKASFVPMALIEDGFSNKLTSEVRPWGEIKKNFTHFADSDVIMAKITPCFQNRKSAVAKSLQNGIAAGTTELYVFRAFSATTVSPDFVLLNVKTPAFIENGVSNMTGTAGQQRVPKWYFAETPIPLPPIAEQKRIIAKVDALMALCDKYEERSKHTATVRTKLSQATLSALSNPSTPKEFEANFQRVQENFDLLIQSKEDVERLRSTILQLAVMGKLVPQDPNDEPASVLLEKIRKEREKLIADGTIKKPKQLPPISQEELPFELPAGWEWVRLGDAAINRDSERVPLSANERAKKRGRYDYYGASGVIDQINDYIFDKPLLLVGEDGANLIRRSKPIAFIAYGKYWVNNHAHVLDSINIHAINYLSIFFNATDLRPYVTGTAQPKMNQAKMNTILCPMPPINEQKRITQRVADLMNSCDLTEERISDLRNASLQFMKAFIHSIAV